MHRNRLAIIVSTIGMALGVSVGISEGLFVATKASVLAAALFAVSAVMLLEAFRK